MLFARAAQVISWRLPLIGLVLGAGLACPSGTGTPPSPTASQLGFAVALPGTARSGLPLAPQPVIQLEDPQGQPFAEAGRTVLAVLVSPGGTLAGTLQVSTNPQGRAAFTDLVINGPAGSWTLRFDSPGLSSATAGSIQLAGGNAALLAPGAGDFQTAVAGTAVAIAPSVRVSDAAGNAVPEIPVAFAASNGGTVEGAAALTNAQGFAAPTRWILGTTIGLNRLTATSSTLSGASVTFTATGTVGPPAVLTLVAGDLQSATVGGDTPIQPAAKLTDAAGHLLPGVAVSFAVTTGDGSVAPANPFTNAAGIATLDRWTLGLVPGDNTLTVSRAGANSFTIRATGVGFTVLTLSGGNGHSCAIDPAHAAFCWGSNVFGQIGNGAGVNVMVPTAVGGGLSFTSIAAGTGHSCGVASSGDAYCWGTNDSGQLGDGTLVSKAVPTLVSGGFKYSTIMASAGFTCGILLDKTARCWGFGQVGQLGDGTSSSRSVPTLVTGGHLFDALAAGTSHTCGIEVGGAGFCWGFNGNGRLGDGSLTNRTSPTAVSGGLSFTAISAGGSQTCGVTTGGAGYCWGSGGAGLLGNGGLTDKLTPFAISGGLLLSDISAHLSHTCALTTSGVAYCWGTNGSGELGDGTLTSRLVPTAVAGGLKFSLLRAGAEHTCGRSQAGGAYCWGRNDAGAVGDGTLIPRSKPVGVVKP